jgi:Protein of unknown function (DUF4239)
MAWIHDLSPWVVATVMIAFFSGGAVGGLAISRGWSRRRGLHALVDNGVIGWIFSAVLGIYAIAIGLIAVASWNNSSEASSAASHEAAEVAALYRDVQGYPEPVQTQLEQAIIRYVRSVVHEDWPAQSRGYVPQRGTHSLDDIAVILYPFAPQTISHQIVHAETLRAFNALVDFRRLRLEAVDYSVPGALWGVVLVGAVISILASYVFSMDSFSVHATMTGLLAAMIGLVVFFIAITDHPYQGRSQVTPQAYELVLKDLIATSPSPSP